MARKTALRKKAEPVVEAAGLPEVRSAGGLEGAARTSRETMTWVADRRSADQIIREAKVEADARGREIVTNDGFAQGVVDIHRDSIVGAQYRLNAQPNWRVLQFIGGSAFDEQWAEEWQLALEELFNLVAESPDCWLDASRQMTFTQMVRLAIAVFCYTGETLGTVEFIRETARPFTTAVQLISPARLSNPEGRIDDKFLRDGIRRDLRGKPEGYFIKATYPTEFYGDQDSFRWVFVPARKPWGRKQVIHIKDAIQPSQTRGIAGLVAVLKQMRMTKKFQDITLQNAVVNASYAATIESELPSEVVAAAMGSQEASNHIDGFTNFIGAYLNCLGSYIKDANGIGIDGVKMPHLFPGTKLNARPLGTPGGVGTDFETSLLRHTAAGLGMSYEEFAGDFSKTNYSSGKLSTLKTERHMAARKKFVADRFADDVLSLWVEEYLNAGGLPLPRGWDSRIFYEPFGKDALLQCDWIGAGRGQVDELKETQAALLRIKGGLSTHEYEIARMGRDYRRVFAQLSREQKYADELGLILQMDKETERDGSTSGQTVMAAVAEIRDLLMSLSER